MTKTKKYLMRSLAFLLCLIIIFLDTANMPVFATSMQKDTSPITNEQIAEALSNAQIVLDEGDEFSDGTSDVNWDELGNIQSDYDYFSELYAQAVANDPVPLGVDLPGDDMVYLTQKWLNQEYGDVPGFGSVTENGKTGWNTIYGLTRALQHELGITSLADNFGSQTQAKYKENILSRQDGVKDNMYAILQGALWCKGYSPGYNFNYNSITETVTVDAVFDEAVEKAVIEMKTDAGLIDPDGVVTVNTMKALLSMDAFKLLSSYGGKEVVREMQQKFNREFEEYIGLMPCDGVYGRSTNKATIYVLQAIEGMPVSVATGTFGSKTQASCPNIPYNRTSSAVKNYSGSYYSDSQISDFIELLQFGMYVNGVGDGTINGIFDAKTQQNVTEFQKKFALPVTGKVDLTTWLSLFVSYGDKSRSALACDCATKLTADKAKTLYDNGYRYVGRYLTKVPGGLDKDITIEEAQIILDAGLNFFPIYQTVGTKKEYFTAEQGTADANAAIEAARKLGVPNGTIIYFAVDFDALDVDITNNVLPYFAKVHETMEKSIYKTGVYGVRNVCTRVSDKGYACSSFVSNLSSGFSGNLGFPMPGNWAFDQFATVTVGEGNSVISIDKDGFSGRDTGVCELDQSIMIDTDNFNFNGGSSDTETIHGPTIEVLGKKVDLFEFDASFSWPDDKIIVEASYDPQDDELNVIIGLDAFKYSEKHYGTREKLEGEKHKKAFEEIKMMVSSINKNPQTFTRKYNSVKGCLLDKGVKIGFDTSISVVGYMSFSFENGEPILTNGEVGIIGELEKSIQYPLAPTVCLKLRFEGDLETGFKLVYRKPDTVDFGGHMGLDLKISAGVGFNVIVANAYVGAGGKLACSVNFPFDTFENSFSAKLNAYFYLEYYALNFENYDEWDFKELQIYPRTASTELLSIDKNRLKLIEPSSQASIVSYNSPDVFKENVQVYTKPQIISLENGDMFMTYIEAASDRTSANCPILMYSVFSNDAWSEPKPISNDSTADFEPILCSDNNGGVHILWQNATTEFENDVTIEEMASQIDLFYIHWNGNAFEKLAPITSNNQDLEMKHKIVSSGSDVSIVWQQNSENDIYGLSGTNTILRKQLISGNWQNQETISSNLSVITNLDTSYVNSKSVVAYVAQSSMYSSSINDLEVYYTDGIQTTQLTNDNTPDISPCFYNEELYWVKDDSIICTTNGDVSTMETVIENLSMSVSEIKVIGNNHGKKAIIWEYEDENGMTFYGSNYNLETLSFDRVKPLEFNDGVVRGWDVCILPNGQIEFSYCYADYLEDRNNGVPYGTLSLVQKPINEFYNIAVEPIASCDDAIVAGEEIYLIAGVYNGGSKNISQLEINIFDNNDDIINTFSFEQDISSGEYVDLEIPFMMPDKICREDYRIQILPMDGDDVSLSDNETIFSLGYADLVISDIKEKRIESGRSIVVSIYNEGFETSTSTKIQLFKKSVNGELIESFDVPSIDSGSTVEYDFTISEDDLNSEESGIYYLSILSDSTESDYGNNDEVITIFPDYSVTLMGEVGGSVSGSGVYANDSYASISAIPSPGYQFEGWYEDGVLIAGLPQKCELAVNRNRTLEARFTKTDIEISDVSTSGELKTGKNIVFTVTTTGGTMPYSWSYYVSYNGEPVYSKTDSTENTFMFKPEKEGNYNFVIEVTDSSGNSATYKRALKIKPLYHITMDKSLNLSQKIPNGLKVIYWESSDTRVASVNDNGVVSGKRVGNATISAVTTNGTKLYWEVEVGFTWWQIILLFTGIGVIMLPFWIVL